MRLFSCYLLFLSFLLQHSHRAEASDCLNEDIIPNEYIVRYEETPQPSTSSTLVSGKSTSSSVEKFIQIHSQSSTSIHRAFNISAYSLKEQSQDSFSQISIAHIKATPDKVSQLKKNSNILSIEPNCRVELFATPVKPNDPHYQSQWGLQLINAEAAWAHTTGSQDIIVAVSDTGVDYNHEDLKDNMWVNTTELNGKSGVDDDANGYVDDIYGYDFGQDDGDPLPPNSDLGEHGTHIAGIIGAIGNNGIGIAGLNWKVRLMAIKGFPDVGSGDLAKILKTIYYAVDNGAKIINCSWGTLRLPSDAEIQAYKYAEDHGVLVVAAAGNTSENASLYSPASIETVFTVGSVNSKDQLSSFSNYGKVVSVLAPGGEVASNASGSDKNSADQNSSGQSGANKNNSDKNSADGSSTAPSEDEYIVSTIPKVRGSYRALRGTSMSAPFVSGVAALLLSINPNLKPSEIRDLIKTSGKSISASSPDGGIIYPRLDAEKAILAVLPVDPNPPSTSPTPSPTPNNSSLSTDCKSVDCPPNTVSRPSLETLQNENQKSFGCSMQLQSNAMNIEKAPLTRASSSDLPFYFLILFLPMLFIKVLKRKSK